MTKTKTKADLEDEKMEKEDPMTSYFKAKEDLAKEKRGELGELWWDVFV